MGVCNLTLAVAFHIKCPQLTNYLTYTLHFENYTTFIGCWLFCVLVCEFYAIHLKRNEMKKTLEKIHD